MARYYRRKRYGRRRSTNVVKMKFQSFMDIATSSSSMQIITVSAGGPEILKRLAPQFGAYKYYKIGNISVKLVPASTLPVDPTGLSYEAGEPGVDPRDQLTPGMMRITNGEDIFENLTGISDSVQHELYNNMLLDPRWFKWMLQSGVKRHATPRYWQIGQLHQDKFPGAFVNVPLKDSDGNLAGSEIIAHDFTKNTSLNTATADGTSHLSMFQTGHRGVLGWLPTDGLVTFSNGAQKPAIASPVEVECMKILLPKAYKTVYYYRMFITETVYFREPIVNFGVGDFTNVRPLDIFHMPSVPIPVMPPATMSPDFPTDETTGGNYGND